MAKNTTTGSLFVFADGALFLGTLRDNEPHRHHALQIVAADEPFGLRIGDRVLEERLVLVAPDVTHALEGTDPGRVLLIDGESRLAEALVERFLGDRAYYVPDFFARALARETDIPDCATARRSIGSWLGDLFGAGRNTTDGRAQDPRIVAARRFIAEQEDLRTSLGEIAAHVGLSEGRLTHLFKEEIGVPIRRYVLWLRVQRAIRAAGEGASLTDAAHAAGFADQAHFTRTFREMFGLSPAQVLADRGAPRVSLCQESIGG